MQNRLVIAALGVLVCAAMVLGGCANARELSSVRASGNASYARGNYEQALVEYREYSDRRPQSAQGRYNLGRTLLTLDRPLAAGEELAIAHEVDPGNGRYLDLLCEALLRADRPGELVALLSRSTLESDDPADYLRQARYLIKLGSLDEAHDALIGAARVDAGRSVEPQIALASFYRTIKDEERELQRLRMTLFLDPANEAAANRIRELGFVPGPSFALEPSELLD